MKNIFDVNDTHEFIERINRLTPTTRPQWGKMNVAQMLAHCNVTYELIYENKHPRPGRLMRFLIQLFAKKIVVGDKPYKKNLATAAVFRVETEKTFDLEKERLIGYLTRTQQLGAAYFDGKESHSFGKLSIKEWNTLMAKHLNHHLTQFGV